MKIRIGNCGDKDIVVQSTARGTFPITPLSFGAKIARDYVEIDVGDNEILILRPRGAKDAEGVPIKETV